MSAILSKAKEQVIIYWLAGFYCVLFSGVSLAGAYLTATAGVDFSTLGPDAKMRVKVGIFSVWGTTMIAFVNNAITKVQKGELPIGGDNASVSASRTVTQTVESTVTALPDKKHENPQTTAILTTAATDLSKSVQPDAGNADK